MAHLKSQGQEGRPIQRWIRIILSEALWVTTSGYFYLQFAQVVIGEYLQKETGLMCAVFYSKIGLVYSRTGFGNYFSFFDLIPG